MERPAAPESNQPSDGGADRIDFRRLAELAADAIVVHDAKGLIVWANEAAARLLGAAEAGALTGLHVLRFVPPERHAETTARVERRIGPKRAMAPADRIYVRLDGVQIAVETSGAALDDDLTLVVIRDVSHRTAAEKTALQLRSIVEMSADAIGIARDGRYVYVNPALVKLFGYDSREELVGELVAHVVAPAERDRVATYMRQRTAGDVAPVDYFTRGLRRDGSEFELEVRATTYREGSAGLALAILRDVSAQRAYEARLLASERRFRELFEFVPVSLWEVDASAIRGELDRLLAAGVTDLRAYSEAHPELIAELMGRFRVVSVNGLGRAMAGAKSQEELLGNLEKVHVHDSHARYRDLGLQLAAGRTVAHAEGWLGTIGGELRWIDTTATIVPGHEADWGRILFASVDMTERRRAEEERSALHERLRHSEKLEAVGRLAGGIAHDFNNILSGILGYAELSLLAAGAGTELHEHQERIREAALRARALVRQILTFSQRQRSNERIVDVPSVVREALALMRAGIPATVTFESRIDSRAGATVADPTQVHQIVLNLCANARDAIGPYGRIDVGVDAVELEKPAGDLALPPGRYVRIRVQDDGVGMDAETRIRIFEPYMTTKGPFGGHGLGLPVVHGIVSAAGGAIGVRSEPGKGSTFDVYLPRREAPSEPQPPPEAPRVPSERGARVLLVDDEELVRNAHRRLLTSLGYAVETAQDGEAALALIRASPGAFDVLFTDQSMPRLSGSDLARAAVSIRPDLPVILCTGFSDQVDGEAALALGVRAVVSKPIERDALAATLRAVLAVE